MPCRSPWQPHQPPKGGWAGRASVRTYHGDQVDGLLVRLASILGAFQLDLEPLRPDLETVHRLNGTLGRDSVVEADESEALAQVGVFVDEDFGTDNVSERLEHLDEVGILDIVGEVVDKEIASLRAHWKRARKGVRSRGRGREGERERGGGGEGW